MAKAAAVFAALTVLVVTSGGPAAARPSFDLSTAIYPPNPAQIVDSSLAESIRQKVRILCFVLTYPKNEENAKAVRDTWAKRCTIFYFVSTGEVSRDPAGNFPTVIKPGEEAKAYGLWNKTKLGFKHAYDNYFDQADWFMKADDDTYVVMENLRMFLLDKDPGLPAYYGCRYNNDFQHTEWMDGGAGYTLSKEALRRLMEESYRPDNSCNKNTSAAEDQEMSLCLKSVGVVAGYSDDNEQKPRYIHPPLSYVLQPDWKPPQWFSQLMTRAHKMGLDCCSNSFIASHYNGAGEIRLMEFAIYHIHPFGYNPWIPNQPQWQAILQHLQNMKAVNISKNPQAVYKLPTLSN